MASVASPSSSWARTAGMRREVSLDEMDRYWMTLQAELAMLSTNSRHIVAERSGHFIQLDEPDVVVDAIHAVIEAVRKGTVL